MDIPRYEILERAGVIEIRRYADFIQAETFVAGEGDLRAAGREGFRRLVSYLGGDNRARREVAGNCPMLQSRRLQSSRLQSLRGETIPMTAPVNQTARDNGVLIAFVMPSGHTLLTLPEPSNPRITLRVIPARHVAALRYSGSWRSVRFARKVADLERFLTERGLCAGGDPQFARYNPPYVPAFFRRNEVLIAVAGEPVTGGSGAAPAGRTRAD